MSVFSFIAFFLYIISGVFYFIHFFTEKKGIAKAGFYIISFGFGFHTIALVLRSLESGHAPFANMYESLSFFAWSSVLAFMVIDKKFKISKAAPYFILVVMMFMALASSPLMPKEATPLVPALQSYWLWLHVSVTIIGEAFFAGGFVLSVLYLVVLAKEKRGKRSVLSAEHLDLISYKCISIGFPLFTLGGLVFGMIWAYKAWGAYWSWDPKEVWSLITWMIFALYLHTRVVMKWKGVRSALIAIIGFLSALFTYFGVNYLLSGLHSYT